MNIAELMVRISATDTNVPRTMKGVQDSLARVGKGADQSRFAFNSMNGALGTLAAQATGTNPALATLGRTLGSFAMGGPLVAGVLIGIAAIAKAYDLITSSARKAAEEQRKLAESLGAMFAPKTGPRSSTSKAFNAALQERADLTKKLMQLETDRENPLISGSFLGKKLYDGRIDDVKQKIAGLTQSINDAMAGSITSLQNVVVQGTKPLLSQVKELAFSFEQLRASADEFWGPMRRFNEAFALPSVVQDMTPGAVDISDSVKIANDQAKKINDEAERHAQMIHDAIWGSAAALANSIVSSLNVGGGGKGSNLGGAIGSTAGFAIGMVASAGNPIGGAIGSLLGNIGGSLVGGLFDSKNATNANTNAVRQNTAMMAQLLNSPAGYKVAGGRFDATDVKDFRRGLQRYNTRGGAPILVGG